MRQGILALFSLVTAIFASAAASIVDQPHFRVDGLVIIWADVNGDASLGNGFIAHAGREASHIASLPPIYGAGQLVPVGWGDPEPANRADPAFAARHFFVASNTAFNIDAELSGLQMEARPHLDQVNLDFEMSLSDAQNAAIGRRAQYPHSSGPKGGFDKRIETLSDLLHRATIFRGNRRTAAQRGSIMEQSVRFGVAFDVEDASLDARIQMPDVVFTVYVP